VAYTGELWREAAGAIHGWACDYCGLKAETTKREFPREWRNCRGRVGMFSSMTYVNERIFCTERCCALWNKKPWPPESEKEDLSFA